jgi:hypothetical protein
MAMLATCTAGPMLLSLSHGEGKNDAAIASRSDRLDKLLSFVNQWSKSTAWRNTILTVFKLKIVDMCRVPNYSQACSKALSIKGLKSFMNLNAFRQLSFPVVFQHSPDPFNGIILAVIRRDNKSGWSRLHALLQIQPTFS